MEGEAGDIFVRLGPAGTFLGLGFETLKLWSGVCGERTKSGTGADGGGWFDPLVPGLVQ
jgi:hypothetical protein